MGDSQSNYRNALTIFVVLLGVALIAAFVTTLRGVESTRASNEAQPGTIGLAHPHPPLDKSPGEPVRN